MKDSLVQQMAFLNVEMTTSHLQFSSFVLEIDFLSLLQKLNQIHLSSSQIEKQDPLL